MLLLLKKNDDPNRLNFDNSSAALTSAHLGQDRVIRIIITAKRILSRIPLGAHASFVKWVLSQCLPLSAVISSHLYHTCHIIT